MTRTEKIRRAIAAGNVTKAELSRAVGVLPRHWDRWLAAATPRDEALDRVVAVVDRVKTLTNPS